MTPSRIKLRHIIEEYPMKGMPVDKVVELLWAADSFWDDDLNPIRVIHLLEQLRDTAKHFQIELAKENKYE